MEDATTSVGTDSAALSHYEELFGASKPVPAQDTPATRFQGDSGGPMPGSPEHARQIAELLKQAEGEDAASMGEVGDGAEEGNNPVEETTPPSIEEYTELVKEHGLNVYEQREVAEAAQKFGISPEQADNLVGWHIEREARNMEKFARLNEEELKADWGSAYHQNLQAAQSAITLVEDRYGLGRGELRQLLAGPAGNDARIIKLLYKISRSA